MLRERSDEESRGGANSPHTEILTLHYVQGQK